MRPSHKTYSLFLIILLEIATCSIDDQIFKALSSYSIDETYIEDFIQIATNELPKGKFVAKEFLRMTDDAIILSGETSGPKRDLIQIWIGISDREDQSCKYLSQLNNKVNIDPAIILEPIAKFPIFFGTEEFERTYCVTVLPAEAHSLDQPIPSLISSTEKKRNTEIFIDIIQQITELVGAINKKHGVLHGDIKPQHIFLFKNRKSQYEAKIIESRLAFRPQDVLNDKGIRNPGWLTYHPTFRAPEIQMFCPGSSCIDPLLEDPEINQYLYEKYYSYDPECREDSYALALSLEQILDINKDFLDLEDQLLNHIYNSIIPEMKQLRIDTRVNAAVAAEQIEDASLEIDSSAIAVEISSKRDRPKTKILTTFNNVDKSKSRWFYLRYTEPRNLHSDPKVVQAVDRMTGVKPEDRKNLLSWQKQFRI